MYTMKIILLDILLICAIAEIFAKWSSTDSDMIILDKIDSLRSQLAQKEAEEDIMEIMNNKQNLNVKFVGLHDLPLEEILAAGLPPEANLKKPKKNIPEFPKTNNKIVEYKGDHPLHRHVGMPNTMGRQPKGKYPKKYTMSNLGKDKTYVVQPRYVNDQKKTNMGKSTYGQLKEQPTSNYLNLPTTANNQQKVKISNLGHSKHSSKLNLIHSSIKKIADHYNLPIEKVMVIDLPPNNRLSMLLAQLQEMNSPKHSTSSNNDHNNNINWQNGYNNLLKQVRMQSDESNKKLFRDGETEDELPDVDKVSDDIAEEITKVSAEPTNEPEADKKPESIGQVIKEKSKFYFDKFKKLMQDLVSKVLNKAMRQSEEKGKIRKARQGRFRVRHHRSKRQTQAGYTQDPDTCQKYNENLLKMWETLSKYLNSTETVDERALHNIAVMVEAYLDHQNKNAHDNIVEITRDEKKKDKITEVLRKIKKLLGTDDATEKVKEMVLENFKPEYDESSECKQINEDNLISSIGLSYKNYLDNAKCHGDYDTGLLRGKALLRQGPPENIDVSSSNLNDLDDNIHRSILSEDEESEDFLRGKHPVSNRSKQRSGDLRSRQKRNIKRPYRTNRDSRHKKSPLSMLRRKPKKQHKKKSHDRKRKTHVRSDESCVKYANRKFLITLRTSIERFMDLRDCQHDDTLRTSNNNNRKPTNSNVPIMRTPNERNYIERKLYSDTKLGQKEQNQINNYLSKVKDFDGENPAKITKPIYVVHSKAYKNPILLKIKNKPEIVRHNSVLLHYPSTNIKNNADNTLKSKYNLDNVYKAFLDSSNIAAKNKLFSNDYGKHTFSKTKQNLYDIFKKKIAEQSTKKPFNSVARQSEYKNYDSPDDSYLSHGFVDGVNVNFNAIGDILNEVRNTSLQNSQVDIHFASESQKGYVELSYLVKYPKSIVYRPQYLVKNILQYEDFVKVASQIYVTDDDKQLLKIVRYLPDNSTQTLFETQDFKSPLEIYNINEERKKSGVLTIDDMTNTSDVPELRQLETNETQDYPEYDNQTQSNNITAPGILREDTIHEDDLTINPNQSAYRLGDEKDYATYQDGSIADSLNASLDSIADNTNSSLDSVVDNINASLLSNPIQRSMNDSYLNPVETVNSTEHNYDSEFAIDERIIEILNASLNSGEFVNRKDELDLRTLGSNISSSLGKNASNVNAESIADYLRFKLNSESNLSSASHAYLKELEAHGVSTAALTKSMLRTWWESWKNKLSTKVQTIAGKVSSLLKKLERASSTPSPDTTVPSQEAEVEEPSDNVKGL